MNRPNSTSRWSGNWSGRASHLRAGLYAFARAVSWHRRKLAVLCAVAAVVTGLTALAPPRPETAPALRVVTDLPGGHVLTAADLRTDAVPPEALPSGILSAPEDAIGRLLAGRVPEGQMLTGSDLLGDRSTGSPGRVIAPIRLADPDLSTLLSDGDVVDVLGADQESGRTQVVATAVRVVAVPSAARDPTSAVGGIGGGGGGGGPSGGVGGNGLILVEVDRPTATRLAQTAIGSQLSVIWR